LQQRDIKELQTFAITLPAHFPSRLFSNKCVSVDSCPVEEAWYDWAAQLPVAHATFGKPDLWITVLALMLL